MTPLSGRQTRFCMNNSILSALLWCVFGTMWAGSNFTGLLLTLGFDDGRIGVMLSFGMLFLPFQLLGAYIQRNYFNRKKFWFFCVFLQYVFFGFMGVLTAYWTHLPFEHAALLMMILYALALIMAQAQNPANLAWNGDFVPPRESASFWSLRAGLASLVTMVAGLAMGMLIDALGKNSRLSYIVAMLIAFIFAMLSLWVNNLSPDPNPDPQKGENIFRLLKDIWSNRQFRFLVFFFGFQSLVVALSGNFIFVHLQKTINCSMTQIQIFSAIGAIVGFFSAYLFKVIGSKYGRKPILVICSILKGGEFLLWASFIPVNRSFDTVGMQIINYFGNLFGLGECNLPPGGLMMLPAFAAGGFVNMGLGAGQLSLITSMGNKKTQGIAIALFFSILGICGFISGSPSGFLLEKLNGLEFLTSRNLNGFNLLALITAAGYIVSTFFLFRFKEDGATPTTEVIRVLLSTNPFRSVYQSHILSRPMSELKRINTLRKASGELVSNELGHDLYSSSARVRNTALLNLASGDTPLNEPLERELIKLLELPELGMQTGAAEALGRQKSKKAIPVLIKLFKSADTSVAMEAIFAAGMIGDASAAKALENVISNRRRRILHPAAAEALSKIGDYRYTRKLFSILPNQSYYVLHQQCLASLARLMTKRKNDVHSSFEIEDCLPGSEIARLIKSLTKHEIWKNSNCFPPSHYEILNEYDRDNYTGCLEAIIPAELALFGIRPDAKMPNWQFLSEAFLPGGRMRYEPLNRDDYFANNLYLQLKLWAELKYDPDNQNRFMLLTALLSANALLNEKYHRDGAGHDSMLQNITLP